MSTIVSPPGPTPATYRHWVQYIGCDGTEFHALMPTTWSELPAGFFSLYEFPPKPGHVRVAGLDAVTGTHAPGISPWIPWHEPLPVACPEPGLLALLAGCALLAALRRIA